MTAMIKDNRSPSKHLGNLLLILTAMIWGTAFVGQRVGMDSIEPFTFTAARNVLAAAAVGLVAFIAARRGHSETVSSAAPFSMENKKAYRRQTVIGGLVCGVFLCAASLFQQVGIIYTTAGKSGFITAMYMLLVPIINFVVFRKKNSWHIWLAVAIGVAGMYLLCITEGFRLTRGDTLVCVSAVLFSCHILSCGHFVRRGDPLVISAVQFTTCAVLSGLLAFIFETPAWEKTAAAALPILYCGLLSGGVGYTLQIIAQKYTDPTVASLLMSLESVFAVLAGALILNERMTVREGLGCVVMFLAIILVQIPLPKKRVKSGKIVENQ